MKTRYAISDIHGCIKTFKALLSKINFSKADELYLLGDYIDKGPKSKEIIDYIWGLQASGHTIHCLKGNHEQMMLDTLIDGSQLSSWLLHGGWNTISSFKVRWLKEIPDRYIHWMKQLPYYFELDDYILVHAGLDFKYQNPFKSKRSMLWSRNWQDSINYNWLGHRVIIHGHTPRLKNHINKSFNEIKAKQYLNIDNGCFIDKSGYGHLLAFDMTNQHLYSQPCKD